MTSKSAGQVDRTTDKETADSYLKNFYKIGGTAALLIVLVAAIEILLTLLPGGERTEPASMTVTDWFTFFQNNWFMALRNLGLINIIMTLLGIPIYFAVVAAHQGVYRWYAAIAMVISFIGIAVFLATNRAFSMLDISNLYATATSDAQRAMLAAAGQAMLSVGQSHTSGTFLGFFLAEIAGILISVVMLRSGVFNKAASYAGILGFGFLFIFEICSSFVPALFNAAMLFAISGGLLSMVWYILIALRLFKLSSAR